MKGVEKLLLDLCLESYECKTYLKIIFTLFEKHNLSLRGLAKEVNIVPKNIRKWVEKLEKKEIVKTYRTKIEKIHILNLEEIEKKYGITREEFEKFKQIIDEILKKEK